MGQWLGSFERAAAMQMVAAAAAFLLLTRVKEDYRPHEHEHAAGWLPPGILGPGIAIGFVNVHYPVVAGFLVLHLESHGNAGPAAFSAYALLILLARFFLGGLPDRVRPSLTYYAGLVFMAAGLLWIASGPPRLGAIAAAALLGFGFSFPWGAVAFGGDAAGASFAARARGRRVDRVLRSVCGDQFLRGGIGREPLRLPGYVLYGGGSHRRGRGGGAFCICRSGGALARRGTGLRRRTLRP